MRNTIVFADANNCFDNLLIYVQAFTQVTNPGFMKALFQAFSKADSVNSNAVVLMDYLPHIYNWAESQLDRWCGHLTVADDANFREEAYLYENKDVRESVKAGGFASGFDHFDQCGRFEQRKQRVFL